MDTFDPLTPGRVTIRALTQRLARRYALQHERFRTTRGDRWYSDLGRWHVVDASNYVVASWSDIDSLIEHARDLFILGDEAVDY